MSTEDRRQVITPFNDFLGRIAMPRTVVGSFEFETSKLRVSPMTGALRGSCLCG